MPLPLKTIILITKIGRIVGQGLDQDLKKRTSPVSKRRRGRDPDLLLKVVNAQDREILVGQGREREIDPRKGIDLPLDLILPKREKARNETNLNLMIEDLGPIQIEDGLVPDHREEEGQDHYGENQDQDLIREGGRVSLVHAQEKDLDQKVGDLGQGQDQFLEEKDPDLTHVQRRKDPDHGLRRKGLDQEREDLDQDRNLRKRKNLKSES